MKQPQGYEEAVKAVEANTSRRAQFLKELERWVEGTQYDHLPDWFSDEKPLFERAPCVVYPAASVAIASNVDLLLGEGRFPTLTSRPEEDDDESDVDALNEDSSAALDRLIDEAHKQSYFRAAMREAFEYAQGTRSVAAISCVRGQKLCIDLVKSQSCEPELDADGNVTRLIIQYPYIFEWKNSQGEWMCEARIFRRVIDSARDVTYKPAKANESGIEPKNWLEDPDKTRDHGLGFCPVVWYAHMRGCATVGNFDGRAIHERLLDEIRAHDFSLSQRHRAALYAGDPLITEHGVELGYNPSAGGRTAKLAATPRGGEPSTDNPVTSHYDLSGGRQPARKKSPSSVWQYESNDTRVELHTLPGDALKAIEDNARDLRIKLCEGMAVVLLDPENLKFATTTSGKALEALKQRQLDRCDSYRDDIGPNLLIPVTLQQLRICAALGPKTMLKVRGLKKALPVLQKFLKADPERATDVVGAA